MNNPYILLADCSVYLVTDGKVICPIPTTRDIPMVLLASYFVYNIEYPRGFGNFFVFWKFYF